jgi:putative ABC transport system ATP-binding protein
MADSLVEATRVWREYRLGGETVEALKGVDLSIPEGDFVALLGRSGSGKSTLLNLLGGLDRPTRGSIRVAGRELAGMSSNELSRYRRDLVGFIFQSFNLVPSQKAWENVALPLIFEGVPRPQRKSRALELLERVGLEKRAFHTPGKMSGGEQQRVAIARALVNNPRMLLCDEPTGNLDTSTSSQIMALLNDAHQSGATLIMVTHDPGLAETHTRRTLSMADGQFIGDAGALATTAHEGTDSAGHGGAQ